MSELLTDVLIIIILFIIVDFLDLALWLLIITIQRQKSIKEFINKRNNKNE